MPCVYVYKMFVDVNVIQAIVSHLASHPFVYNLYTIVTTK